MPFRGSERLGQGGSRNEERGVRESWARGLGKRWSRESRARGI